MGNENPEIKSNKDIRFELKLEKVCYLPSEKISGTIILAGKPGLKETQLINPKALVIINQKQKYRYRSGKHTSTVIKNFNIYEKYLIFNTFIGANLLLGVQIPFSIQLPHCAYPSCSFSNGGYVKHNFSVEFPSLNIRRTLKIVVKNNPTFTIDNKLLKKPFKLFDKKSKSKFLINEGDYEIHINLPKNVFYYDEPIPYEINLNCKNLNLIINEIEIFLIRYQNKNCSDNYNEVRRTKEDILLTKRFLLKKNTKEYIIKNILSFPHNVGFDKFVYPPLVYNLIDKNGPYKENVQEFEKLYHLSPSCRGQLLSVEYKIKINLLFDSSFTFDEKYLIPIDFCSRPQQQKPNYNNDQIAVANPIINNINSNRIASNPFDIPQENINYNENKIEINNNEIKVDQQNNNNFIQQFPVTDINECSYNNNAPPVIGDNDINMKTI